MAGKFLSVFIIATFVFVSMSGQAEILTRAEKSGFKSTSDYKDVTDFIDQLKRVSDHLRVEIIGRSAGRWSTSLMVHWL
jgi:hypothetical protein